MRISDWSSDVCSSDLKDFSRVDRSRSDLFNVNEGLDSALKICQTQLKGRVGIVRQYGKLPQIECSPSQLNQIFLNLITNAGQAIEGEGRIYLHTQAEDNGVAIRILDHGSGMSEEEIGRAACRDSVCQNMENSGVAV